MRLKDRPRRREYADIIASGKLKVAVSNNIRGFSCIDTDGVRSGFDIDLATAISHAIFCDSDNLVFADVYPNDRLSTMKYGLADIGLFNLSALLQRLQDGNILATHPYIYDVESALVPCEHGVTSIKELKNPLIAVQAGTTTRANLTNYLPCSSYSIKEFGTHETATQAYLDCEVDAYVLDSLALHMTRDKLKTKKKHIVTNDKISIESLIPAVHANNVEMGFVVYAVLQAILIAEANGVTSENIEANRDNPVITFINEREFFYRGRKILSKGYFGRIIESVGNYAEIYERNFRLSDGFEIPRRFNALFNKGGLFSPISIL